MGRRCFCIALVLLFCIALVSPCFASDNTIGEIQQDLNFLGFSVGNSTYVQYRAFDGVVPKELNNSSSIPVPDGDYVYLFWDCPSNATVTSIKGTFGFSGSFAAGTNIWYGGKYVGWSDMEVTRLSSAYMIDGTWNSEMASYSVGPVTLDLSGYDYLILAVKDNSGSASIKRSLSFSEAVASKSMTLSPSSGTSNVSLTGRVGFRPISSAYVSSSSTSSGSSTFSGALLNIAPLASGNHSAAYFTTTGILSSIFGGVSSSTGAVDSDAVIRTTETGTIDNPSYRASYSSGGNIDSSAYYDVMAFGNLSGWYGDDDGLVDTVKHMDTTLDGVADNMQQIIDKMNQTDQTGDEISGTVTDDTISTTDETLSGGVESIDSVSTEAVSGFSDLGIYGTGMVSLMSVAVPELLWFGDGHPLYFAGLIVLVLALLIVILRRL